MKINTEQWDEWLFSNPTDAISAESELTGIVACMRAKKIDGAFRISSPRLWVFRRLRRLWPLVMKGQGGECENDFSELLYIRARRVAVDLPESLYRKILSKPHTQRFIRAAWLRGVWGCVGSIYNPRRGYYCLMRFHDPTVLQTAREVLLIIGVTPSVRQKGDAQELMIRDLQGIQRLCYFIGCSQAAQRLEDRSLLRANRELANQQANCDAVNIRRSLSSSSASIAMIKFLLRRGACAIPRKLIPLAKLRLEYPEMSLSELGDKLRPQVSKSTVKYRLEKLRKIAETAGFPQE